MGLGLGTRVEGLEFKLEARNRGVDPEHPPTCVVQGNRRNQHLRFEKKLFCASSTCHKPTWTLWACRAPTSGSGTAIQLFDADSGGYVSRVKGLG